MIYFKKNRITSINNILENYSFKEFKSPFRSTIPLLTLFKQDCNLNFDLISKLTDQNTKYIFEFETLVRKGHGSPSCTDLMIVNNDSCIAIEAKRTEGKYETVQKWLAESTNKKDVLDGWIDLIYDKTRVMLSTEQILDLPYQMIHRVASACSLLKLNTNVVYLGFDLTKKMMEYYTIKLNVLSMLLEGRVQMQLHSVNIKMLIEQMRLESIWNNGIRDLSFEVKSGIENDLLMRF